MLLFVLIAALVLAIKNRASEGTVVGIGFGIVIYCCCNSETPREGLSLW